MMVKSADRQRSCGKVMFSVVSVCPSLSVPSFKGPSCRAPPSIHGNVQTCSTWSSMFSLKRMIRIINNRHSAISAVIHIAGLGVEAQGTHPPPHRFRFYAVFLEN